MNKYLASVVPALALGVSLLSPHAARADDSSPFKNLEPVRVHGTIATVAAGNKDFSTLVSVLTATDLVKTLNGKGPFTVFAPTNEAFKKIPPAILSYLTSNPAVLKQVLLYHVAAGNDGLGFAFDTEVLPTVQGEKVFARITFNGETPTLRVNNSKVIVNPILTDNGIIYVIDSVLQPQF